MGRHRPAGAGGGIRADGRKGQVLAEAELAWPTQRVALLHGEQAEEAATFERAGWAAYSDDSALAERVIKDIVE